jgi:hypothetical protein
MTTLTYIAKLLSSSFSNLFRVLGNQNMYFYKSNFGALFRKRIIPIERPQHVGQVPTLADSECRMVSATDIHSR